MKKRVLSLVLALSMTVSVLPVGALADNIPRGGIATQGTTFGPALGSTGTAIGNTGLVIDSNGRPTGATSGTGWNYSNNVLTLTSGTFDFSGAEPLSADIEIVAGEFVIIQNGSFKGKVVLNSSSVNNCVFYDKNGETTLSGELFYINSSVFCGANATYVAENVADYWDMAGYLLKGLDAAGITAYAYNVNSGKETTLSGDVYVKQATPKGIALRFVDANGNTDFPVEYNGSEKKLSELGIATSQYNGKTYYMFDQCDTQTVTFKSAGSSTTSTPTFDDEGNLTGATSGDGWSYENDTLTLTSGTYNFGTYASAKKLNCKVEVKSGVTVTGGEYKQSVENEGTIENGVFYQTNSGYGHKTVQSVPTGNGTVTGVVCYDALNGEETFEYLNLAGINTVNGIDVTDYKSQYNRNGLIGVYPNTEVKAVINDDVEVVNLNGVLMTDTEGLKKYNAEYTKPTLTFTMPDEYVVVNKTRYLSVKNGTAKVNGGKKDLTWNEDNSLSSGQAIIGMTVTVKAKAETEGKTFIGWTLTTYGDEAVTLYDADGNAIDVTKQSDSFTFVMPAAGELMLTANYKTALAIDENGVPKNKNADESQGWTYDGTTLTLYDGTNYDFGTNELNCKVVVKNGATATGGVYKVQPEVEQGGKIENGVFYNLSKSKKLATAPTGDGTVTGIVLFDQYTVAGAKDLNLVGLTTVNGVNVADYKTNYNNWGYDNGGILGVYPGTTVTATAEGKVYNLNGVLMTDTEGLKPYNVSYDETSKTLTFAMPSEEVRINRVSFLMAYNGTGTANGGTSDLAWDSNNECYSGDAIIGASATVKADDDPADKKFTGWTAETYVWDTTGSHKVPVQLDITSGSLSDREFTFTMPDKTVHLTANYKTPTYDSPLEIGDDGKPVMKPEDKDSTGLYKGDGWTYDESNNKLTLTANPTGKTCWVFDTNPAIQCDVVVESGVILSNGTFDGKVENNGTIELGTYNKKVTNNGTISNSAVFYEEVENTSTGIIQYGRFKKAVTNHGTIEDGTFEGTVTNDGTIEDGTFGGAVTGTGTIEKGAFIVADGETAPNGAKKITLEGGSIDAVNGLYMSSGTVYAMPDTEVTVRANSVTLATINGKSIEEFGATPSDDKKAVTFTMPNDVDEVVLGKKEDSKPTDPSEPTNPDKPKPDEPGKDDTKAAQYTIKVDEYAKVNGKSSVTVKEGDTVSLTVSETPDGQTFDYWDLPSDLQEALTKQDSTFNNKVQNLSFRMPDMGGTDASFSVKTGFRSAELPADSEGTSALGTAAIVAAGGATAGILVWQGVSLGVDSYLQLNLPDGVPVPTNRRELVTLLWETAGKPEVALPALYNDVPAEDLALQKASRWAEEASLVKAADDKDASRFDPDHYVTKMDVFGAWLKLQKLLKNK